MIKVSVQEYCQNCPFFIPEVRRHYANGHEVMQTTVFCKQALQCEWLRKTLEKMPLEEKEDGN